MATKLGVYQEVARLTGQPRFATITDDQELRYLLDDEYAGAIDYVLNEAPWRFCLSEDTLSSTAGTLIAGYGSRYNLPADHIRIVGIYASTTAPRTGDLPVDCRILGNVVFSNFNGSLRIKYVSTTGRTESDWPSGFAAAVAGYLAFKATQRISALNGRTDDLFGYYQQTLIKAAEREAVPESPWFLRQLDGSFLQSVRFVLSQGAWRFALRTAGLLANAALSPANGFSQAFSLPTNHFRTHSIHAFQTGGVERPVDVREEAGVLSANVGSLKLRYVTTNAIHDPASWPEAFTRAVAAHLGIDLGDMPVRQSADGSVQERQPLWPEYVRRGLEEYGVPADPWLPKQLDGSFASSARFILTQGPWRFALVTTGRANDALLSPAPGFAYAMSLPANHVRTISIVSIPPTTGYEYPLDVREQGGVISSNVDPIRIRFISSSVLSNPASWPESFLRCVAAHLGIDLGDMPVRQSSDGSVSERPAVWVEYVRSALVEQGVTPDPWLRYQFDGSLAAAIRTLLWEQDWRFARTTVALTSTTASTFGAYKYRFTLPADVSNVTRVFWVEYEKEYDLDFRIEDGFLHCDQDNIFVQYTDRDKFTLSTLWPGYFSDVLLAYLSYRDAMGRPDTPGAVTNARLAAYREALRNAKTIDDQRERPRTEQEPGRFNMARWSSWRASREDG